ncbi:bifunctional diguanylate cyclase/phosphodiesterase [Prosthecomicrobium sp. N25]|uniref:bifunctional diguanylate cyclase/phosphodiesterase n=1 Tax=Prosthecomicrobium sp. N25 TaxID=3129254 RepID=UPI003076958B
MTPERSHALILRIVAAYALGATVWIFASDSLLAQIADPGAIVAIAKFKGVVFVAVTAGLLYLALRRFASETAPAEAPKAGSSLTLVLAISAAMATTGLIGTVVYRAEADALRRLALEKMELVTAARAQAISRWVSERRRNLEDFAESPLHRDALARVMATGSPLDRASLEAVIDGLRARYGFASVGLFALDRTRLAGDGQDDIEEHRAAFARALAGVPAVLDAHRHQDGTLRLAFMIPFRSTDRTFASPLGVVVGDLRPSDELFPMVVARVTAAATERTLLVRMQDDEIEILSGNGGTDQVRMSVQDVGAADPAVRRAMSGERRISSQDRDGRPILAAGLEVPQTGWSLFVSIDEGEALANLKHLAVAAGVAVAIAFAASIALAVLLWQRQRLGAAMAHLSQARLMQAAEDRYRATFEQVQVGIVSITADGRWSEFNSAFLHMTGYDAEAIRSVAIADLIHPDDLESAADSVRGLLTGTKETCLAERRIRRSDGTVATVMVSACRAEHAATGEPYVIAAFHDVSERRLVEEELRRAAAVFSNTQEAVVITDPRGRIVDVNPAFTTITGWAADEVTGRRMSILSSGLHDVGFYKALWRSVEETGHWQGEIWNRRRNGELFPEWLTISTVRDAAGQVTHRLGTFIDIGQLKTSEARLAYLANHDPLTDLPNRFMLMGMLARSIEQAAVRGAIGAVIFLDLDRFKTVNDSLGHAAGDELIVLVADRLRRDLLPGAILARLGGDEFVCLVPDAPGREAVAELAERWNRLGAEEYVLSGGRSLYISVSLGISVFPHDGTSATEVLQHADAALYEAKAAGGSTYRFYTRGLTQAAAQKLEIEVGLRRALERGEFELLYQPVVASADGRTRSVEALLRWNDPERGVIEPARFIPFAEETGLILAITDWVLPTACRQMQAWREAGLGLDVMAVNLSAREFRQADIVERVARILHETGLPAQCLELEITEGALLEHGDSDRRLAALRELGVRLAVDDFGTGYSSLSYLSRLPLDKLKIDKSFVRNLPSDPTSVEIARTIIALARNLELVVVAEGVETEGQFAALAAMGCDFAQGYLFSRPVAARDLPAVAGRPGLMGGSALRAPDEGPRAERLRNSA